MNRIISQFLTTSLALGLLMGGSGVKDVRAAAGPAPSWRQIVANRVPLYGHRNWIVVADSAYPAQTSPGVETIVADADQIEVVGAVLAALRHDRHVRPILYTDAEMRYVSEKDAPGITAYRTRLARLLAGRAVSVIPHEQVISKLDEAGKTFKVLIIKTNLTVPYTSVFMWLNCGYWSDAAEKRLRAAMAK